ncbi:hypothetical protein PT931_13475 [Longispora urticae]
MWNYFDEKAEFKPQEQQQGIGGVTDFAGISAGGFDFGGYSRTNAEKAAPKIAAGVENGFLSGLAAYRDILGSVGMLSTMSAGASQPMFRDSRTGEMRRVDSGWDSFSRGVGELAGSAGGFFEAGTTLIPGGNEIIEADNWLYHDVFSRALGTYAFAAKAGWDSGNPFALPSLVATTDWETWRQAWNDTRKASWGQATTYLLGGADPRTIEGKMRYVGNPQTAEGAGWEKWMSGSIDFVGNIALDPLNLAPGGQLKNVGKLKVGAKFLNSAEGIAMREASAGSGSYVDRLHAVAAAAPSSEHFRLATMPATTKGAPLSVLLTDAAKNGTYSDFHNILMASVGDPDALARLASESSRYGYAMSRKYGQSALNEATLRNGLSQAATDMSLAQADTATRALLDSMVQDGYVPAKVQGALVGQYMPDPGKWGQLRAGFQYSVMDVSYLGADDAKALSQVVTGKLGPVGKAVAPGVELGAKAITAGLNVAGKIAVKAVKLGMPSQGYAKMVDLYDETNTVNYVRSNWQRSGMSPEQVDFWVKKYAEAGSPLARKEAIEMGEGAALQSIAAKHGWTKAQVEEVIPQIAARRASLSSALNSSRKYLPAELRKIAQQYVREGNYAKAELAKKYAQDVEDKIASGDLPHSYLVANDPDMNPLLMPTRKLKLDVGEANRPVLESQLTEQVPMTDWRGFSAQLGWLRRGTPAQPWDTLGDKALATGNRAVGTVTTGLVNNADRVTQVWKNLALTRFAQLPRNLSDDLLRASFKWSGWRLLADGVTGVKNAALNRTRDLKTLGERRQERKAIRAKDNDWSTIENVPANAVAAAPGNVILGGDLSYNKAPRREAPPIGGAQHVGAPTMTKGTSQPTTQYKTYTAAFADGAMPLDVYLNSVEFHGVHIGDLPFEEATFLQAYQDAMSATTDVAKAKQISRTYVHAMTDLAMWRMGKDKYRQPQWQQEILDDLTNRTIKGQQGKTGSDLRGSNIVDPFTGHEPKFDGQPTDNFTLSKSRRFRLHPEGNHLSTDNLYDYVVANADDLLRPDTLLYMRHSPDGSVSLSIATAKRKLLDEKHAIKPSASHRYATRTKDWQTTGSTGVTLHTAEGPVKFEGAFEGQDGQQFRARMQARGRDDNYASELANTQVQRMVTMAGDGWQTYTPEMTGYSAALERAMNRQIANDTLGKKFLRGELQTVDDAIDWMERTPAGRAYVDRMGHEESNYTQRPSTVKAMVDRYFPAADTPEGQALRAKALDGTAEYRDFVKVIPEGEPMPQVHGASIDYSMGNGPFVEMLRKFADKFTSEFMDKPMDRISRFPAASERYQYHLKEGVDNADFWASTKGETYSAEAVTKIQAHARDMAMADVRHLFYDTTFRSDLASSTRFIMPFSSAILDSAKTYGELALNNPLKAIQIYNFWQAPERNGMIQDEHGNLLIVKDGEEHWYAMENGQQVEIDKGLVGESRYVHINLPDSLGRQMGKWLYGVDVKTPVLINKDNLNVFLNLPTAGPMVALPTALFLNSNPEFSDNVMINKFILPMGPTASPWTSVAPSTVRTAWNAFSEDDDQSNKMQALAIYQAELVEYSRGTRNKPPTIQEATALSAHMKWLRFMVAFASPASTQFKSPYQPYIDSYRHYQASYGREADARFYQDYGKEFFGLTMAASRNIAGSPATMNSFKGYQKYADLVGKYPEFAPLIVGADGAGEFNRSVYNWQLGQPMTKGSDVRMRQAMTLSESVEDLQVRQTWMRYGKLQDALTNELAVRGLKTVNAKGAEDLKGLRDNWVMKFNTWVNPSTGAEEVSPWFKDYSTSDRSKQLSTMLAMKGIASDTTLLQRDDIRGLSDYLQARQSVRDQMNAYGYKALDSKKAAWLRQEWEVTRFGIVEANTAFGALYHRWLSHDDLTVD